jgi:helicase MOV-10
MEQVVGLFESGIVSANDEAGQALITSKLQEMLKAIPVHKMGFCSLGDEGHGVTVNPSALIKEVKHKSSPPSCMQSFVMFNESPVDVRVSCVVCVPMQGSFQVASDLFAKGFMIPAFSDCILPFTLESKDPFGRIEGWIVAKCLIPDTSQSALLCSFLRVQLFDERVDAVRFVPTVTRSLSTLPIMKVEEAEAPQCPLSFTNFRDELYSSSFNMLMKALNFESMDLHVANLKKCLSLEISQMQADMNGYELFDVSLKSASGLWMIELPGLVESHPPLLYGDQITLRTGGLKKRSEKTLYIGFVYGTDRAKGHLFVKFNLPQGRAEIPSCNVRFCVNSFGISAMIRSLSSQMGIAEFESKTIRHEEEAIGTNTNIEIEFLDKKLNEAQREAVTKIFLMDSNSKPLLLFGPAGTGKTRAIIEAVCQIQLLSPGRQILCCAPSNEAADLLAALISEAFQKLFGDGKMVLRLNSWQRKANEVAANVQGLCHLDQKTGLFSIPSVENLKTYTVIVTTCFAAEILDRSGLDQNHFSYVIIDEAAQAIEPEALIPITSRCCSSAAVVLCGDHFQLGPVVRSSAAENLGLCRSLFERLFIEYETNCSDSKEIEDKVRHGNSNLVYLVQNYRSHPSLLLISSELFYKGNLRTELNPSAYESYYKWSKLPNGEFPLLFHGVNGKAWRQEDVNSYHNSDEVERVKEIILSLISETKCGTQSIGVIGAFRSQVRKIRAALRAENLGGVNVGSVLDFQGSEKDVIIVSTVQTSRQAALKDVENCLGVIGRPREFNVIITRPRALLIVVGDPFLLAQDEYWGKVLHLAIRQNAYRGDYFPTSVIDKSRETEMKAEASMRVEKSAQAFEEINLDIRAELLKQQEELKMQDEKHNQVQAFISVDKSWRMPI